MISKPKLLGPSFSRGGGAETYAAKPDMDSLAAVLQQIPPLPRVITTALAMMRNPNVGRAEVSKLIALDEGIASLCLRMVNSAYYCLPRRIASLDEAIGYLGFDTVGQILCAASTAKPLVQSLPAYLLDRTMLWKHSVAVAGGCEYISRRRRITPQSEVYVAGLLHDVGKLAVDLMRKHQAQWVRPLVAEDSPDLDWLQIERSSVGHDHAEIGGILAQQWNLPETVTEAIAYHHAPGLAKADPNFAAAVHVANVAAMMCGIGVGAGGLLVTLDRGAIERLKFTEDDMFALMMHIKDAVVKAEHMLGMSGSG